MLTVSPTRRDVVVATKDLLKDGFPWNEREIASELHYRFGWTSVHKGIINSILYSDLSYCVRRSPDRKTWQIR